LPLYDYDCAACGRRFEVIHGVFADPPAACPLCGKGPVKKAITAASVHYKGSGWAKKERRAAIKSNSASRSGDDGSSDAGSSSSDAGSSKPDAGSTDATPAAATSAESSTTTTKPSKPAKSETSSKTPAGTSD
jgi:putative FmdB family regulatory protein